LSVLGLENLGAGGFKGWEFESLRVWEFESLGV